jgi:hypothetical protein
MGLRSMDCKENLTRLFDGLAYASNRQEAPFDNGPHDDEAVLVGNFFAMRIASRAVLNRHLHESYTPPHNLTNQLIIKLKTLCLHSDWPDNITPESFVTAFVVGESLTIEQIRQQYD